MPRTDQTTSQNDPAPQQTKKRKRLTEVEKLTGGRPQTDFTKGELRSGHKMDPNAASSRSGGFRGRDPRNYIYVSDIGTRSGPKRKTMPKSVTEDLLTRSRNDPASPSVSRRVETLRKTDSTGETELRLKDQGVARDHILADSRIRKILGNIYEGEQGIEAKLHPPANSSKRRALLSEVTDGRRTALEEFFKSLTSEEKGAELNRRFLNACRESDASALNDIKDETCEGLNNLRFGLADINTVVSNEFDPVVIDGRLNAASQRIHEAVRRLGWRGLIDGQTMSDALSITKDRQTHQDVTSTVLRSGTISTTTASRTIIDLFAAPSSPAKLSRSHSFTFGSTEELEFNIGKSPAREYHHNIRHTPNTRRGKLRPRQLDMSDEDPQAFQSRPSDQVPFTFDLPFDTNPMTDIAPDQGASPKSDLTRSSFFGGPEADMDLTG